MLSRLIARPGCCSGRGRVAALGCRGGRKRCRPRRHRASGPGVRLDDGCVVGKPPALGAHSTCRASEPRPLDARRRGHDRARARSSLRGRSSATAASSPTRPTCASGRDRLRDAWSGGRRRSRTTCASGRACGCRPAPTSRPSRVGRGRRVRAPGVVLDQRSDRRAGHAAVSRCAAPTLRRGCRVGGGAVLLPAWRWARRRSWLPARLSHATCRRAPWSWACPHGRCARWARRSCLARAGAAPGAVGRPRGSARAGTRDAGARRRRRTGGRGGRGELGRVWKRGSAPLPRETDEPDRSRPRRRWPRRPRWRARATGTCRPGRTRCSTCLSRSSATFIVARTITYLLRAPPDGRAVPQTCRRAAPHPPLRARHRARVRRRAARHRHPRRETSSRGWPSPSASGWG